MSMYVSPTRSDDNTAIPVTAASSASAMLDTASSVDAQTSEYDHGLKALKERRLLLKQQREQSQVQSKDVAVGETGKKPSVPVRVAKESSSQYTGPTDAAALSKGIDCPHCGNKVPLGDRFCYKCYLPVVRLESTAIDAHEFVRSSVSDEISPENQSKLSKEDLEIFSPPPSCNQEKTVPQWDLIPQV